MQPKQLYVRRVDRKRIKHKTVSVMSYVLRGRNVLQESMVVHQLVQLIAHVLPVQTTHIKTPIPLKKQNVHRTLNVPLESMVVHPLAQWIEHAQVVVLVNIKQTTISLVPPALTSKPVEVDFTSALLDLHQQIVRALRVRRESIKHLEPLLVMHATFVLQGKVL